MNLMHADLIIKCTMISRKISITTLLIGRFDQLSLLKALILWISNFLVSVYDPLPRTITDEEYQKATIQRMIDMEASPISGIGSKYDYEKNEWKK